MLQKTRGIVLHVTKYAEDALIVDIFTEDHGTVGFYVKVPRSKRSPIRSLLLKPLSILEIAYEERPTKGLQRIQDMALVMNYRSLPYHPMKEMLALFLSEFLYHAIKNEGCNRPLFLYLIGGMEWLDEAEHDFANFHLAFLLRLTRFLGFWPEAEGYFPGAVYDLLDCSYSSTLPAHGVYLEPSEASLVPLFMRMDFSTMHLFKMNRVQRGRLLDVLNDFYRLHVPGFPELKSLDVLRDVLN